MNDVDLGWVAGLIEGEGTIYWDGKNIRLAVGMVDEDVIHRLHQVTGIGYVHLEKRPDPKQDLFKWIVSGIKAAAFLQIVYPLLGERRQAKITEVTERWTSRFVSTA